MLLYASNYKHESFSFQVNYSVILQENSDLDKLFVCFQIISKVEYCLSQTPVTSTKELITKPKIITYLNREVSK